MRNKKPTRPSDGLHPDEIIAVTLALARKMGFARLSMRRIAGKLGVSATAIYYHFRNKSELLDKVSGHIMDSIAMPDSKLGWRERLSGVVLAQQMTMLAYPGLATFQVHHRECLGALRWTEMILEVLQDTGLSEADMARALSTLTFFVHPLTLAEDKPHPKPERVYRQKRLAARMATYAPKYPCFARMLPLLVESPYETYLPVALEGVIAESRPDSTAPIEPRPEAGVADLDRRRYRQASGGGVSHLRSELSKSL